MSRTLQQITADRSPLSLSAGRAITTLEVGRLIRATNTITLTLPPTANVSAGWATGEIHNSGTGIVTIAATGTDPLEGVASNTLQLFPKQKAYVFYDTDGWRIAWIERTPIIATVAAASIISADVAIPVGYSRFRFEVSSFFTTTAGSSLIGRISDNGTANIKSASTDYYYNLLFANSTSPGANNAASTCMYLTGTSNTQGNALRALSTGMFSPGGAAGVEAATMFTTYQAVDSSPARQLGVMATDYRGGTLNRTNLMRLSAGDGNNWSGNVTFWGEP